MYFNSPSSQIQKSPLSPSMDFYHFHTEVFGCCCLFLSYSFCCLSRFCLIFRFWEQSTVECWRWPKETLSEGEVCQPPRIICLHYNIPPKPPSLQSFWIGWFFLTCMVALSQHLWTFPGGLVIQSEDSPSAWACVTDPCSVVFFFCWPSYHGTWY